jgi:hypothetical protein
MLSKLRRTGLRTSALHRDVLQLSGRLAGDVKVATHPSVMTFNENAETCTCKSGFTLIVRLTLDLQ